MTIALICLVAGLWLGGWIGYYWRGRAHTALLDLYAKKAQDEAEQIQEMARTYREVAQLKADLADAYDVIAIQSLLFGPGKKQKEAVH